MHTYLHGTRRALACPLVNLLCGFQAIQIPASMCIHGMSAEAEFRAYHLLSLMGQHGKFKGDQQAFLSMLQVRMCASGLLWPRCSCTT